MNELQTFAETAVISPAALDAAIAAHRSEGNLVAGNNGGVLLLRVDQREGCMVYGPDNVVVSGLSKWAVNPHSLQMGWVLWVDSVKEGEVMAPIGEELDRPKGEGWQKQVSFELTCISGDDEGELVRLQNSSKGALQAWDSLLMEISRRPNIDFMSPVVQLSTTSYYLKKYNRDVHNPQLAVVDWLNPNTGDVLSSADDIPFDLPKEKETDTDAPASPVRARARSRSRS